MYTGRFYHAKTLFINPVIIIAVQIIIFLLKPMIFLILFEFYVFGMFLLHPKHVSKNILKDEGD